MAAILPSCGLKERRGARCRALGCLYQIAGNPARGAGGSILTCVVSEYAASRDYWIGPAMVLIQDRINAKLAEHKVTIGLFLQDHCRRAEIDYGWRNLIGFVWMQFMRAIGENKRYRRCEYCRTWFESGGTGSRSDKRFCTRNCKGRAQQKATTTKRQEFRQRLRHSERKASK
jgi:hypothetical protein